MKKLVILVLIITYSFTIQAQEPEMLNLNKPEREQWFAGLGYGMFIHWSFDVRLGMVISHSMVGASAEYLDRYVKELPGLFNPEKFNAVKWAQEAKMAGMKYLVFTSKHHNGFCMYDTKTTDFSVMNTPYGKDVTRQIIDACRKEGLAVGSYFSPDDFYFLYKQGTLISRTRPEALAEHNEELNEYTKKQMRELMTQYGKIDIVFLDGKSQFAKTELAKVCWEINPDVVVTRGAIPTPEQKTPDSALPSPWEACYTLGNQWQFRPTNEEYKSAGKVIEKLIEIRAKGGNFLLNFGPDAEGNFPSEQLAILNEISLWMFINQEAFENTVPHQPVHEENLWYLMGDQGKTAYVFILEDQWKYGERKSFLIKSFRATDQTRISVLGHNGKVLEYQKEVDPSPKFSTTENGLEIDIMRAQRIYNDRKWKNPLVVKIEELKTNNNE